MMEALSNVVVVRSNSIVYNPRVTKIATSLSKRYSTSVLGWNREGISKEVIWKNAVHPRLFELRAPFGKLSLLAYFPLYWAWVLFQLLFNYRPDAVHACDLDSALPCYIYKTLMKKKLVFDVCDRYAMGYIPPRYRRLYNMVNSLEESIAKNADVLVNVSERLMGTFRKRPKQCAVIMNCSEDHNDLKPEVSNLRQYNDTLKIVYTGNIIRSRGLREVALAVKHLDKAEFLIAGRPVDKGLLDEILQVPNVKYMGLLRPTDAWKLQAVSDIMISFYDLKDPISSFSMGNKIFEAMMHGLPIITNVSCELINETKCGVIVKYDDSVQVRKTLIILRDDVALRKSLGANGRKAFVEKYNWNRMEAELYRIYDNLLSKK
jgi:glycosyltransferase involved in cell wall biosynthesis